LCSSGTTLQDPVPLRRSDFLYNFFVYVWLSSLLILFTVYEERRKLHVDGDIIPKLALTSPTSGGRSVGIVRLRIKATEFSLVSIRWKTTYSNLSLLLRSRFA
jgi:hypothetical protein